MLQSLDPERLGTQVRAALATGLERLPVAPLLGKMLAAMIADGRHRPVIDSMVRWAGLVLEDNEQMVRDVIHTRANALLRFTGLDERLANSVLDGLYKLLAEVLVDQNHPLRAKVEEGLAGLARDLVDDPETQEKVERLKRELIANPAVAVWWTGVWERLRTGLIAMVRGHGPPDGSFSALAESLTEMGVALRDDPRLQTQVNRFARRTAVGIASRHGGTDSPAGVGNGQALGRADCDGADRGCGRPRPPIHPHERHAGGRAGRGCDSCGCNSLLTDLLPSLHLELYPVEPQAADRRSGTVECGGEARVPPDDLASEVGKGGIADGILDGTAIDHAGVRDDQPQIQQRTLVVRQELGRIIPRPHPARRIVDR